MKPEVGKEYFVSHTRKGRFRGIVHGISGEWIEIEITGGMARAALSYNEAFVGDVITCRDSHCFFEPVPQYAQ